MKPIPSINDLTRPYWDAARDGRLVLQRCAGCQATIFYPRPWCPHCWSRELAWCQASGRGQVETFTVVHHPPSPAFAGEIPYVLAIIQLLEGPRMMANLLSIDPGEVRVGLPVQVIFETRGEWKIPQFEPDTGNHLDNHTPSHTRSHER